MTFSVDANELDLEPGEYIVPPANRDLVRIVSWFISVTFLLSFAVEFHQETVSIRSLKQRMPLTASCIESSTQSMTWIERMAYLYSGLEDAHARECHEQQRIHALLSIPNPFIVLINLIWRGLMGDNAAVMLTRLLSQQTYVVQVSLIFTSAVVIGLIVYNLILSLPTYVASLAQSRDARRREVYDDLQQQLRRQTAGEAHQESLRAALVKRKRRDSNQKLAVYHAFMRAQKTPDSLVCIA